MREAARNRAARGADREAAETAYQQLLERYLEAEKPTLWTVDDEGQYALALTRNGLWVSESGTLFRVALAKKCSARSGSLYHEAVANLSRHEARRIGIALYAVHDLLYDNTGPACPEESEAEAAARAAELLDDIETRLVTSMSEQTARKAQQTYLLGMLPGLLLVVGGSFVAASLGVWRTSAADLLLATVAGAAGALLSVMARVAAADSSRKLVVDDRGGPTLLALAGGFRPFVGAILGAALVALVRAGIVPLAVPTGDQGRYFLGSVAFLAGFSERVAQDALVRTSRSLFAQEATAGRPSGGSA